MRIHERPIGPRGPHLESEIEPHAEPRDRARPIRSSACGEADTRSGKPDRPVAVPRESRNVPDTGGGDGIAVKRRIRLRVERQQAGRGREFQMAEAAVRIELEKKGASDRVALNDDLAPAPATPPLGHRPDNGASVGLTSAPGSAQRVGHSVKVGPAPLVPSVRSDSAHRSAVEVSSPASTGAARPWTRTSWLP